MLVLGNLPQYFNFNAGVLAGISAFAILNFKGFKGIVGCESISWFGRLNLMNVLFKQLPSCENK